MAGHMHETQEGGEGEERAPSPKVHMVWRAQPHDGVLRDVHRPHRSLWSPGAWMLAQEEHVLGTLFCKLLDACLVPCSGCRVQEVEPGISPSSCSQDSKWAAPSPAYPWQIPAPGMGLLPGSPGLWLPAH